MSFFKKINNFFKDKKPQPQQQPQQNFQARTINFSNPNLPTNSEDKKYIKMNNQQSQVKIQSYEDILDTRYQNLQKFSSLKDLGLKKDQIQQGEIPVLVQNKFVFCKMSNGKYQEVLLIQTNYKICIKPLEAGQFSFFPLGKLQKLNKYTNNQNAFKLLILLKDGRKFKFRINSEVTWRKIFDKIDIFSFIKIKTHFFAFKRFQVNPQLQQKYKGWQLYDPIRQFKRMKINLMDHSEDSVSILTSDFKILDNRDGRICTTYPKVLVVPSRMPYDYLVRCSKFRSRNRMPALTYAYQYQKGKFSCIYRSSQSKVGVQNSRCFQDQAMIRCIGNHSHDPKDQRPYVGQANCKIYDARNYIAALGNKISGKGFQSTEFYPNIQLQFLNIPNIHAVRDSYNKALKAAMGQDLKFHLNLAQSQWYDYIFLILAGAVQIARNLVKGINNLIHCSDGWDRTAQLCSLAALILDPYYRTIQGFEILIQKDWIHFGHQFSTRLGQGMNNPSSQQKSQVFLQFLDCVSQVMQQYPADFEFNFKFLQQIAQQAYSHLYGNFLCNCQLEMQRVGVANKTVSLWSYFAANRQNFLNPFYIINQPGKILQVSSAQKHMRFFKEHFFQYVEQFNDAYDIYPSCQFTQDNLQIMHRQLLKQKVLLQERFKDNQRLLRQIDGQILKRISSDDKQVQTLKIQDMNNKENKDGEDPKTDQNNNNDETHKKVENKQQIIDELINKCEKQQQQVKQFEQRVSEIKQQQHTQQRQKKRVRKSSNHLMVGKDDYDSDSDEQQKQKIKEYQNTQIRYQQQQKRNTGQFQGKIAQIDPQKLNDNCKEQIQKGQQQKSNQQEQFKMKVKIQNDQQQQKES